MDISKIQAIHLELGLTCCWYDRVTNLLTLDGPPTLTSGMNGVGYELPKHPFFDSIPKRFHEEIIYIFQRSEITNSTGIFFEFQLQILDQLRWFLLAGNWNHALSSFSGIIISYHQKKIEELEKEALSKAVKGLILQGEARKRTAAQEQFAEKLTRREADLLAQSLQASQNASRIKHIVKSLESSNVDRMGLIRQLKQSTKPEINWLEFKSYFNQVDPEFVPSLWERFPDLTDREIRICVLVRLGLSTKDMAHLTKLTPKTIEIYRYRIRKKMKLKRTVPLMKVLSTKSW